MSIFVGPYEPHGPAFGAPVKLNGTESREELEEKLSSYQATLLKNRNNKEAQTNVATVERALKALPAAKASTPRGTPPASRPSTPSTPFQPPPPVRTSSSRSVSSEEPETPRATPKTAAAAAQATQAARAATTVSNGVPRSQAVVASAEPADTQKLTGELEQDKLTISTFKDRVEKEKDSAIEIQGKIKKLSAALAASEKSLKEAQKELKGKSSDHGDALEKVTAAEAKVAACSASILGLETGIGALTLSLEGLSDEIKHLKEAQDATLEMLKD